MEKELFEYVAERAQILATSESSKQATKDAAVEWQNAVATDKSDAAVDAATTKFVDFLVGRPREIDNLIAFAKGKAVEIMGEEAAGKMLAEQEARKAQGAKYCNCPSCTAASEILAKFGRIEL